MSDIDAGDAPYKRLFDYDAESGELIWKWRDELPRRMNKRYCGKVAGTINKDCYIQISISNKRYYAHRIVMAWHGISILPGQEIDHINGNFADNRIENLRLVSPSQNQWNRGKQVNNTSGHTGVFWHAASRKWTARIYAHRKAVCLGVFCEKKSAINAVEEARSLLHGEFARAGVNAEKRPPGVNRAGDKLG